MATQRRRGAAALPLVTASATGCRSDLGAGSADPAPSPTAAAKPLATTEADWAGVGEAPGRQGKLSSAVYRVGPPRSDLSVRSPGKGQARPGTRVVRGVRPGEATMVMGDLVVTKAGLQKVTDTLQKLGVGQTAVHKHLLAHSPQLWRTHFEAEGPDGAALARAVTQVSPPG